MTSSVIRDSFRLSNLKKFIYSLATGDNLYVGIGRPQYWDTITNADDQTISNASPLPYSARNDLASELYDREDLMSLKKLNPVTSSPSNGDMTFGVLKNQWTAGQVYDTYRHDWDGSRQANYDGSYPASLASVTYVVVNTNYDIYICLKQGRVSGPGSAINSSLYSPETGVPVGTNTGISKTADGYYWKYIAATSGSDLNVFSSITNHPVQTLTSAPSNTSAYYPQWISQQNSASFKSGIYCINVTAGGSGYNSGNAGVVSISSPATNASFKIVGDGTGLAVNVTYGAGGSIVDVEVSSPGYGYTYAVVSAVGGSGAAFDIIYTPTSGLGCNPVKDCSAMYLLVTAQLNDIEGGKFTIANSYRKICLVSNPLLYGSTTLATASDMGAYITLNLISTSGTINSGDIITGTSSGAKARVIDVVGSVLRCIRTSSENIGLLSGSYTPFAVSEQVTSQAGAYGTIASVVLPDVDPDSGEFIYSEYRTQAIPRSSGGTEIIKIIIEF